MELIASLALIFKSKLSAHFLLIEVIFFGLFFRLMKTILLMFIELQAEREREEYF